MTRLKRTVVLAASIVCAFAVGAGAAAHGPVSSAHAVPTCSRSYYKNVSGHCVRRPVKAARVPAGATARCRDRSYSFSEHASGTCSHHGGVAVWIHHP